MTDDAPALRPDWYLRGRLRLRHLRLLMVLDEVNNIGEAARQMATTQPAVSKMLAEIEKIVGASLFTRSAKGTFPTAHGVSMIRHATWVLGDLDRMGAEWSGGHLPDNETIRAGVNSSTAAFLMPHALIALPQLSNARVLIREGSIEALLPDVHTRKLDLLIARLGPETLHPALVQDVLGDEPMCVVASASHPLAGRTRCTWQEVTTFPWILPPAGSPVRAGLDMLFLRLGVAPPAAVESASVLNNMVMMTLGDHVSLVPQAVAAFHSRHSGLCMLPLELPAIFGPLGIVRHRSLSLTPGMQALVACLKRAASA